MSSKVLSSHYTKSEVNTMENEVTEKTKNTKGFFYDAYHATKESIKKGMYPLDRRRAMSEHQDVYDQAGRKLFEYDFNLAQARASSDQYNPNKIADTIIDRDDLKKKMNAIASEFKLRFGKDIKPVDAE